MRGAVRAGLIAASSAASAVVATGLLAVAIERRRSSWRHVTDQIAADGTPLADHRPVHGPHDPCVGQDLK